MPVTEIHSRANQHVASIVDAVMIRSHDRWDRRLVRNLASRYLGEFDNAPVQQFVELLVIKEVLDELRRIDPLPSIAS